MVASRKPGTDRHTRWHLFPQGMRSFAGAVLLFSGLSVLQPVVAADSGSELFAEYCAGCHGADRSGLPNYSRSLEEFTARLEGVTENMPDFAGFFDPDEIVALYTYLTTTAE